MKESGYYPAGAEFLSYAPYNKVETPEKEFDVTCSQTLSKTTRIFTGNYVPQSEKIYENGVGYLEEWIDTSDTDWSEEYLAQHKTPKDLIRYLKEFVTHALQKTELPYKESFLKDLLQECKDWVVDEFECVEG